MNNETLNWHPQLISHGDTITANKEKISKCPPSSAMLANVWLLLGFWHVKEKKQLCLSYLLSGTSNENTGSHTSKKERNFIAESMPCLFPFSLLKYPL